jgi:hypothetical protein
MQRKKQDKIKIKSKSEEITQKKRVLWKSQATCLAMSAQTP